MLGIGAEEYHERQAAMRRLAARSGLEGVVAWSRGGSAQDRYADVYHLTGCYQHQPFLPDVQGRWQARGHAAVVLPVDGPALLLTDSAAVGEPPPAAPLRTAPDLVAAVAEHLRGAVRPGRVGLVGGAAMAAPWWCRLRSVLPAHELVAADELGWAARRVKSAAELRLLRASGALGGQATGAAWAAAVPGATEAEVAAAAVAEIVRAGGAYYGMGISSGARSHTYAACDPAPYRAGRRLSAGDLLRFDLYGSVHGYLFGLARTWVVGAEPTTEQRRLLAAVRDSALAGIEAARPGQRVGEMARRCQEVFERSEFAAHHGLPPQGQAGPWGHGLGLSFEPPWVSCEGPGAGERIEAGMCLVLGHRIAIPSVGGAAYQDGVIVTDSGPEIITPGL
ncbi:M24 family metallopeptidase [Nonomuraea jiangxiensis]|uniref:Xaa-Pro aminopeptidase n=1 Tax=Nonomuraea jiangxiensis TaxID=633440 RepID=A0A1G9DGQ1_9ACTN|nr:M24 family metallopeptidase [Nonomuraea jiangxiensis]SDK63051.1 Xaa-Pro aminopeptidase [Nonomuraea jiangxiensis]